MKSLKIIWEIVFFTIKLIGKDRKTFAILLLMPFILISILGISLAPIFGDSGFSFDKAKLGLVDEDKTITSRLFVDNAFNNLVSIGLIESVEFDNREDAEENFNSNEIDGILYIHNGYSDNYLSGNQDQLLLLMNPLKSEQAEIIKEVLSEYHIIGKIVIDEINKGRSQDSIPTVDSFISNQVINLEVNRLDRNTIDAFQYYTIGMGVMYTLFTMFTGIGFILDEKQQHTFNRIRIMPFSTSLFFIGKSLAIFLIIVFQMIILFVSCHFVFGVNFGDTPIYMLLVILVYSVALSGLVVLLMGFIHDQSTLNMFYSIGVPIIAALGGSMLPVSMFPWFIEPISNFLPNRHAIDSFFNVILGRPEEAFNSLLYLLIFALVTFTIGVWRIRRKGAKLT